MVHRTARTAWCLAIGVVAGCATGTGGTQPMPATLAADSAVRAAIAVEATLDPAVFPATSVGVLPLLVRPEDPALAPLGYGLAELLMTDLARSRELVVVDRLRVQALRRELALADLSLAEPGAEPRLGRILGARHLVLGSLAATGAADLRIDARLARTEDATLRPIAAGAASLDDILEAQKALAFRVFDALGVILTPAERAAIERRPTRNLAALLAFSRGVEAEYALRFRAARREYRDAIRRDPEFREPRERLSALDAYFPDPYGIAAVTADAINGRFPRPVGDVVEPAFHGPGRVILVIPITIR